MPKLLLPIVMLSLAGCDRFPQDDSAEPIPPPPPPAFTVLEGVDLVVLWADRDLEAGEHIERLDQHGQGTTIGNEGHLWIDLEPTEIYRWVGPAEELDLTPEPVTIAATELPLSQRHDLTGSVVTWSGPALDGLSLAMEVERQGERWLDPDCPDEDSCWAEEPTWWTRWDDGALPDEIEASWYAEEEEPVARPVTFRLQVLKDEVGFDLAEAEVLDLQTGRSVLWGEVHAHTNLSYDGCEDLDNLCAPRGDSPALDAFSFAADAGLDFSALTDHAEFDEWSRDDLGLVLNIWEETLRLAQEQDGAGVIPLVGFEWTGSYNVHDPDDVESIVKGGGHRTVLFDSLDPCEDFWIGGIRPTVRKASYGIETYRPRVAFEDQPDLFLDALDAAATACHSDGRYLSWFHHPAMDLPRPVLWRADLNRSLGDRVVEIYSEHGSSECEIPTDEGCDWGYPPDKYTGSGSVQVALQEGYALGFVSGTDSHDGRPGSTADGPGAIVGTADSGTLYIVHLAPGGITGVLAGGATPGRVELLEGLDARNTLASSWRFESAEVAGLGQDGVLYLPGDDVPAAASPLTVMVRLEDVAVESWRVQVLDAWGDVWLDADTQSVTEPLDIAPGDARYVRVRVDIQGTEHRLWASPFFGVE